MGMEELESVCCIQGHRVYKNIWEVHVGELLIWEREPHNTQDLDWYTMALIVHICLGSYHKCSLSMCLRGTVIREFLGWDGILWIWFKVGLKSHALWCLRHHLKKSRSWRSCWRGVITETLPDSTEQVQSNYKLVLIHKFKVTLSLLKVTLYVRVCLIFFLISGTIQSCCNSCSNESTDDTPALSAIWRINWPPSPSRQGDTSWSAPGQLTLCCSLQTAWSPARNSGSL